MVEGSFSLEVKSGSCATSNSALDLHCGAAFDVRAHAMSKIEKSSICWIAKKCPTKMGVLEISDEQLRLYALGEMPMGDAIDLSFHVVTSGKYQSRVLEMIAGVADDQTRRRLQSVNNELTGLGGAMRDGISRALRLHTP
jgi:hypothetical protein